MAKITGFHHVAIRARDFEKTVRFYEEGLGCVRRFGWGEGDTRAALMDVGDGNYVEIFCGRGDEEVPEGGVIHFALRTEDPDACFERAVAAGATPTVPPKDANPPNPDRPITFRVAFVKGLDGEVIEFFHHPDL
jgi:glyoxylase I family protein